jgi:hypothetical protein
MAEDFQYDVFLSHSAKDKAVVRLLAERLRNDALLDVSLRFRVSEFGFPPLAACLSAHAFGSDWAQLEAGTFRFRDPLNKERRFIPLRLDDGGHGAPARPRARPAGIGNRRELNL